MSVSYDVQITKIGPAVFLHSSHFYPSHKMLCFTMLFSQSDTPKVPVPVGYLHLM